MDPQPSEVAPLRPTLLTVLCILTFIGSGWGIFKNLNNYRHAGLSSEVVSSALDSAQSQIRKDAAGNPGADVVIKMLSGAREMADPFKIRKNALLDLLASLLTLGGGLLMFQMRKPGFWVYVLGTALSVMAPLLVFGVDNIVGIVMGSGTALVGVIFCVLYASNLKLMR
jgi:hypothetical protein